MIENPTDKWNYCKPCFSKRKTPGCMGKRLEFNKMVPYIMPGNGFRYTWRLLFFIFALNFFRPKGMFILLQWNFMGAVKPPWFSFYLIQKNRDNIFQMHCSACDLGINSYPREQKGSGKGKDLYKHGRQNEPSFKRKRETIFQSHYLQCKTLAILPTWNCTEKSKGNCCSINFSWGLLIINKPGH